MDELDRGDPASKAWEEFRASFASAYLLHWLVSELGRDYPGYFDDLRGRLGDRDSYRDLLKQDGAYDGEVPVHAPDGSVGFWAPYEEVAELESRLFPHRGGDGTPASAALSMVVVTLHSALEWYVKSCGTKPHPTLPKAIKKLVERSGELPQLTPDQYDRLRVLDELRHIIVHGRQVVDQRYADAVPENKLLIGEFRPITDSEVHTFADVVFRTALMIRGHTAR